MILMTRTAMSVLYENYLAKITMHSQCCRKKTHLAKSLWSRTQSVSHSSALVSKLMEENLMYGFIFRLIMSLISDYQEHLFYCLFHVQILNFTSAINKLLRPKKSHETKISCILFFGGYENQFFVYFYFSHPPNFNEFIVFTFINFRLHVQISHINYRFI